MKYRFAIAGTLALACVAIAAASALAQSAAPGKAQKPPKPIKSVDEQYEPGPDSKRQPGVPEGKSFSFTFDQSKIFPGTTRTITVYVPAQYTGDKPACLYVGLDSLGFNAPIVFDNLIHKKEMPVTIGVGISSGQVPSSETGVNPRFNRSNEFDSLNGNLARMVLEEILPEVERRQTPDGLPIRLSRDPNDRATGGGSTGGIGAFTLAWERPDAFRRVFTAVGTFVGMRGGDRYPVLVRKTEPKPIRMFMQDGANDQWMGGPEVGDWWMSNQTMLRALEFAGYQVEHAFGEGSHSGRHATMVFPDAVRFLWKDWPSPIAAGESQNLFLQAILEPGAEWEKVSDDFVSPEILASNAVGDVFFRSGPQSRGYKISAGGGSPEPAPVADEARTMAFGPDGRAYVTKLDHDRISIVDPTNKVSGSIDIDAAQILVTHAGNVYVTETYANNVVNSKIWLIDAKGEKKLLDVGQNDASALALSPDGLWLAVAEKSTHWGYSFQVQADGTLANKQRFYWFHVPDWADDSGAGGWTHDRDGRLYAATRMGVEVFDRNGRTRAILPLLTGADMSGEVTGIAFGGEKFDTLFVTSGNTVWKRKLKFPGFPAWEKPIKLPPWGGG